VRAKDNARKLAAVRAVLAAFETALSDDPSAAAVAALVETPDDERVAFIAGLRELADFLDKNPAVPAPRYGCTINVFPEGDSNDARRAGVDLVAVLLGATTRDRGNGHYGAVREFGTIEYSAVSIDKPEAVSAADLDDEPVAA
jgi:hypothetical protein